MSKQSARAASGAMSAGRRATPKTHLRDVLAAVPRSKAGIAAAAAADEVNDRLDESHRRRAAWDEHAGGWDEPGHDGFEQENHRPQPPNASHAQPTDPRHAAVAAAAAAHRRPGSGSSTSDKPAKTTVAVPVYSVAGKRTTIEELLRDKIRQRSKSGAHQLMKAFRAMDNNGDGHIGRGELKRTFDKFNIVSTPEVINAVMSRFDHDGDGEIDFNEFVRVVLPEDFPVDASEQARRVAMINLPLGGPKPAREVQVLTGEVGSVAAVERMLRDKMMQKFKGARVHLRHAFQSFDRDEDGEVNREEFKGVLDRFHIAPTADVVEQIFAKYDHDRNGRLSFDEFINAVVPIDFDEGIDPSRVHGIRADVARELRAPREALEAAAAERGGSLLLSEARGALQRAGRGGDDDLMRALKDLADESPEGLIPASAMAAAVEAHERGIAGAAVKAASRDYIDGFGRGEPRLNRASVSVPAGGGLLNPARVEAMLREKVMTRNKGGKMELRRAFTHFDKERTGFITRDALAKVLHHFHLPLRPGELDAFMARYDSSGTGRISYNDFVSRLLPADYPTATQQKASEINAKVAAFFQTLTGLLATAEKRGGVPGSVTRAEALALARRAAASARVSLAESAAAHAADAAARSGSGGFRVRREPFVAALQVAVRIAEEDALADTPPVEPIGGNFAPESIGADTYVRPRSAPARDFPKKLSVDELQRLVQDKLLGKTPTEWTEAKYAMRVLDPRGSGSVTRGAFRSALHDVLGLKMARDDDVDALFSRCCAGASSGDAHPVHSFVRRLLPEAFTERPDGFYDKIRDRIPTDFGFLRKSFKRADVDKSGTLSVGEIRSVLRACDIAVDDDTLYRMMRKCDLDGSGAEVNYSQFAELIGSSELAGLHAKNTAQAYLLKEKRRPFTPTPAVNHFTSEQWEVRPEMGSDARRAPPETTQADRADEDALEVGATARSSFAVPGRTGREWVPPPTRVYEVDYEAAPGEPNLGSGHYVLPEETKPARVHAWGGASGDRPGHATDQTDAHTPRTRTARRSVTKNGNAGGRHTAARSAPQGLVVTGHGFAGVPATGYDHSGYVHSPRVSRASTPRWR